MSNVVWLFLLVVLIVLLIPAWPYSSGWGWYPSGGLGAGAARSLDSRAGGQAVSRTAWVLALLLLGLALILRLGPGESEHA